MYNFKKRFYIGSKVVDSYYVKYFKIRYIMFREEVIEIWKEDEIELRYGMRGGIFRGLFYFNL